MKVELTAYRGVINEMGDYLLGLEKSWEDIALLNDPKFHDGMYKELNSFCRKFTAGDYGSDLHINMLHSIQSLRELAGYTDELTFGGEDINFDESRVDYRIVRYSFFKAFGYVLSCRIIGDNTGEDIDVNLGYLRDLNALMWL